MAEEKRDELERLIEKQKGKVAKEAKPAAPVAEPAAPVAAPPPVMPPPAQQLPSPAPAGFAGMQPSVMEEEAAPVAAPPPVMPQQPIPQQPPMQPAPQPTIQEPPVPEPEEEMATLQEPSLPVAQLAYNRTNIEEIESLIESVVEEKWRQAMDSFGDINLWKEKARTEIVSIKQELIRLSQRFENMEKAMIGKVHEYDSHVLDIGAEIKAIEKILQKIVEPLAQNIRDLEKITKRLKK